MIIDIIVILKFYLIFKFYITGVSVFDTRDRILTPYIQSIDTLYTIDESSRQITIILFIINFTNNLF